MGNSQRNERPFEKQPEFARLKKDVLEWLAGGLPEYLTYHSVDHTEDVLAAAIRIADAEGVKGADLLELKTAAVFHDTGFVLGTTDHEEASCELAREWMPKYGYHPPAISRVCEMILATNIPQNPRSHLGEVLCDADLDYLGRDDFWPISDRLFREFKYLGVVSDEEAWNRLQVKFFESHSYFTDTARAWRNEKKAEHLAEIQALVEP